MLEVRKQRSWREIWELRKEIVEWNFRQEDVWECRKQTFNGSHERLVPRPIWRWESDKGRSGSVAEQWSGCQGTNEDCLANAKCRLRPGLCRADQQPDTGEKRLRNEWLVRPLKEQQKTHLKGDATPIFLIQQYKNMSYHMKPVVLGCRHSTGGKKAWVWLVHLFCLRFTFNSVLSIREVTARKCAAKSAHYMQGNQ